jgi:hypothetical protein
MKSNCNDYRFSEMLKVFESKLIVPQRKKVDDATNIMNDPTYKWRDEAQKTAGQEQLKIYNSWLQFYLTFYEEGLRLCVQHENLVNTMSKVYDKWYSDISNEGKMETELMSSQADILCELFGEIYKELAPLKLEGMKPPSPLNMK